MRRQVGFTVIEVSIFLAISGLLVLIAFAGTGQLISSTRFTDGVNSLESFMRRQYEEVASGVNVRSGFETCSGNGTSTIVTTGSNQAPGTTDCIVLGKALFFNANSSVVDVQYVVGSGTVPSGVSLTLPQLLNQLDPTLVPSVGAEVYEIPWQIRFTNGLRRDGANSAINAVAILRNPTSSQIATFLYSGSTASPNPFTSANVLTASAQDVGGTICLQDDSVPVKQAAITLIKGQGSSNVNSVFENIGATGC